MGPGYPFRSWSKRWSRTFLLGFLVVIVIMTAVDRQFADFEYVRAVDLLIIVVYGLFWLLLWWLRPSLFEDR